MLPTTRQLRTLSAIRSVPYQTQAQLAFCHSTSPEFLTEQMADFLLPFVYCKSQPSMDARGSDAVVKSPTPILLNAESVRSPSEPACRLLQACSPGSNESLTAGKVALPQNASHVGAYWGTGVPAAAGAA